MSKHFFPRLPRFKIQTSNELVIIAQSCLCITFYFQKLAFFYIVFYGFLMFPSTRIKFNGQKFVLRDLGKRSMGLDEFQASYVQVSVAKSTKFKAILVQASTGPEGSRRLRLSDFQAIGTRRLPLPQRKCSWYSFLLEAESTPGP